MDKNHTIIYFIGVINVFPSSERTIIEYNYQGSDSTSSKNSFQESDVQLMDIADEEMNFISSDESGSPIPDENALELKAIHELGEMGYSMEAVMEAMDEVKSTDTQNGILQEDMV